MKKYRPQIISIGADPEFFIVRTAGHENVPEILSADKFLPSKSEKYKGSRGELFFDGVQAEINPTAETCRELFALNIQKTLIDTFRLVDKARNKNKELEGRYNFWAIPTINITKETIKNTDRECRRFGCSPDFNIYDEEKIKYPDGSRHLKRYAGGHIHIGFRDLNAMRFFAISENIKRLVRNLDILLGVFSVAVTADNEGEIIRRKLYGRAGTFRINNHGIEYRVLSSFWIAHPALVSLITSIARDAYTTTYLGYDETTLLKDVDIEEVKHIINTSDRKSAIQFLHDTIYPYYDSILTTLKTEEEIKNARYYSPLMDEYLRECIDKLTDNGYEKYFNPRRLLQNWGITKSCLKKGSCDFDSEAGFAFWCETR